MRQGLPVPARLPMTRDVAVKDTAFHKPPIVRMSCSSFESWIMDPEHRNNMALKKARVQMCRKAQ